MKAKHLLPAAAIGLCLASCSPKYYVPNTQNVPFLKEKGQTSINLNGNGNQLELQSSHALTDHIGIQANGALFFPRDLDNGDGGSGKFIEAGVGYFNPFREFMVFETYGLIGYGGVENHFPSTLANNPGTSGRITANAVRYGIQPALAYSRRLFDIGISSRIMHLQYTNINGNLVYEQQNQSDYLKRNNSNILLEPAITARIGFQRLKLQLQYGYSMNLSNLNFRQEDDYLTAGIFFRF